MNNVKNAWLMIFKDGIQQSLLFLYLENYIIYSYKVNAKMNFF